MISWLNSASSFTNSISGSSQPPLSIARARRTWVLPTSAALDSRRLSAFRAPPDVVLHSQHDPVALPGNGLHSCPLASQPQLR